MALFCVSNVFWIEGRIFSTTDVVIASCNWELRLDLISLSFLDNRLEIFSLIILVVSIVTSLFSVLCVLGNDLKISPTKLELTLLWPVGP